MFLTKLRPNRTELDVAVLDMYSLHTEKSTDLFNINLFVGTVYSLVI